MEKYATYNRMAMAPSDLERLLNKPAKVKSKNAQENSPVSQETAPPHVKVEASSPDRWTIVKDGKSYDVLIRPRFSDLAYSTNYDAALPNTDFKVAAKYVGSVVGQTVKGAFFGAAAAFIGAWVTEKANDFLAETYLSSTQVGTTENSWGDLYCEVEVSVPEITILGEYGITGLAYMALSRLSHVGFKKTKPMTGLETNSFGMGTAAGFLYTRFQEPFMKIAHGTDYIDGACSAGTKNS